MPTKDTSELVLELRSRMGWTQQELAEKGGLRREEVNKVEAGANKATTDHIRGGLAKAFGLQRDELADWFAGKLSTAEVESRVRAKAGRRTVSAESPVSSLELEAVLASEPKGEVVALQARAAVSHMTVAPTEDDWRRYLEGLQREFDMLLERARPAPKLRLPADLSESQIRELLARQGQGRSQKTEKDAPVAVRPKGMRRV